MLVHSTGPVEPGGARGACRTGVRVGGQGVIGIVKPQFLVIVEAKPFLNRPIAAAPPFAPPPPHPIFLTFRRACIAYQP